MYKRQLGDVWNAKTKSFVFGHIAEISPQESGGSKGMDLPRLFCFIKCTQKRSFLMVWKGPGDRVEFGWWRVKCLSRGPRTAEQQMANPRTEDTRPAEQLIDRMPDC